MTRSAVYFEIMIGLFDSGILAYDLLFRVYIGLPD